MHTNCCVLIEISMEIGMWNFWSVINGHCTDGKILVHSNSRGTSLLPDLNGLPFCSFFWSWPWSCWLTWPWSCWSEISRTIRVKWAIWGTITPKSSNNIVAPSTVNFCRTPGSIITLTNCSATIYCNSIVYEGENTFCTGTFESEKKFFF